jgi:oligogalacturonide lyase
MHKIILLLTLLSTLNASAQIGRRFPSERKEITDPVTGHKLIFLTSTPQGDSKIYQTHNQWTSDGQWLIFRSNRVRNEALAVNEKTGEMVQVTEGGYTGMLNVGRLSMKLYFFVIRMIVPMIQPAEDQPVPCR